MALLLVLPPDGHRLAGVPAGGGAADDRARRRLAELGRRRGRRARLRRIDSAGLPVLGAGGLEPARPAGGLAARQRRGARVAARLSRPRPPARRGVPAAARDAGPEPAAWPDPRAGADGLRPGVRRPPGPADGRPRRSARWSSGWWPRRSRSGSWPRTRPWSPPIRRRRRGDAPGAVDGGLGRRAGVDLGSARAGDRRRARDPGAGRAGGSGPGGRRTARPIRRTRRTEESAPRRSGSGSAWRAISPDSSCPAAPAE